MELFIVLSAMAAVAWAASNVIDKVLVSRYIDEPLVTACFGGIGGVIALPVLVASTDVFMAAAVTIVSAVLGGVIWVVGFVPYYRAMQQDSASNTTLFMQSIPLFVLLFSVMTIGTSIGPVQVAGVLLFVVGGVVVQWNRSATEGLALDRTALLVLAASVLFAAGDVLLKVAADAVGTWIAYFWVLVGSVLGSVVLFLAHGGVRSGMARIVRRPRATRLDLLVVGRVLYLCGLFGLVYAVTLGPVAIATAVMNIRPLIVLALMYGIGWMDWGVFDERFDHAALVPKLVAAVIFIVAVYLVR